MTKPVELPTKGAKKHDAQGTGPKQDSTPSSDQPSEAPSVDGNPSTMYLRMLLRESERIKRRADKQSITDVPSVRKNGPLRPCRLTIKSQLVPSKLGTILLKHSTAKKKTYRLSVKPAIKTKRKRKEVNEDKSNN